jgi:FtsP/CotA-like multicopper oxidase with cupredoxin domain
LHEDECRVLSDSPLSDDLIPFIDFLGSSLEHCLSLWFELLSSVVDRSRASLTLLTLLKMALSLSSFLLPITLLSSIAHCATVTYDFDVAWTYANPDGQATRPVMGVNGKWPVPAIVATKGDQVIVNVKNSLGNESTSLHFHGLYQNGTTHMDGPVGVSQCGILPGSSFTYNFTVSKARRLFESQC